MPLQAFVFVLVLFSAGLHFLPEAAAMSEAEFVKELAAADPLARKIAVDYFAVRPRIARPLTPNFILLLRDPERSVRDSAAICLGRLRAEAAYEPILKAVLRNRLSANAGIYSLSRYGTRAVPEMIGALASKRKEVRVTALRYLAASKDERAVEPLMNAFRKDEVSRLVLKHSLRLMGPVIQPPLIELLASPDPQIAHDAAETLARIDDPIAIDAVKLYLERRSAETTASR